MRSISRPLHCTACRQNFMAVVSGCDSVACPYCGKEKKVDRLPPLDVDVEPSEEEPENADDASQAHGNEIPPARSSEPYLRALHDLSEFKLEPEHPRGESVKSVDSKESASPAKSLIHSSENESSDYEHQTMESYREYEYDPNVAKKMSFGEFPMRRHYPTLEAIQRLYVIFSYTAVMIVLPYLALECGLAIYRSEFGAISALIGFSRWAIPVLFGTAVGVGGLLGISEGIKLAIDLQEDMWRAANSLEKRNRR